MVSPSALARKQAELLSRRTSDTGLRNRGAARCGSSRVPLGGHRRRTSSLPGGLTSFPSQPFDVTAANRPHQHRAADAGISQADLCFDTPTNDPYRTSGALRRRLQSGATADTALSPPWEGHGLSNKAGGPRHPSCSASTKTVMLSCLRCPSR